jgi:nicotinamide riboside kinase
MTALRIAIVGAESTGKTTLAAALARRLRADLGLRAVATTEGLRQWCVERGRTPRVDEQAAIAQLQHDLIEAAARDADVVLCDTTPLMIAVYSELLFDDVSLEAMARQSHSTTAFTLLTAQDIPWVADGLQRDGPHVREPVERAVRARLLRWNADWGVVMGSGDARTDNALAALRPVLSRWRAARDCPPGLFSSLLEGDAGPQRPWAAACERCDPPPVAST